MQEYLSVIAAVVGFIMASFSATFATRQLNHEKKRESQLPVDKNPPPSESGSPINDDEKDRQYRIMSQYYSEGLSQSKISFWFSLIFASIGFMVILSSIVTADRTLPLSQQSQTFITLASGTIIDAISALFFVQSNKARQLMSEFFDKLRADKKLQESLKLSESVPDPALQSKLKILLSLSFAEVQYTESVIKTLMEPSENEKNA